MINLMELVNRVLAKSTPKLCAVCILDKNHQICAECPVRFYKPKPYSPEGERNFTACLRVLRIA
jgi:hypothetical protein